MKITNTKIPEWILPYAELGPGASLDIKINDQNFIWYLQAICCPPIFERYLVILHPFWINRKVKNLTESGNLTEESAIVHDDFERVSYPEFFEAHGEKFELETAIETKEKIANKEFRIEKEWPKHICYPGEGEPELEDLKLIGKSIIREHGDVVSDFCYDLIRTKELSGNKVLQGKISELESLLNFEPKIVGKPSAIYPSTDKQWCIVSDYDSPLTFVCGSSSLIDNILRDKSSNMDIYEIKPKFRAKIASS